MSPTNSTAATPGALSLIVLITTTAAATFLAYSVSISIYRLFFHPLARFPGPKLGALTRWYEFYYEIVRKGQMTFQIQKLHAQYGM